MAITKAGHHSMALARFLVVLLLGAPLFLFSCSDAGEIGVNYGTDGNNLPDPSRVVKLFKDNGITMVRIYDANPGVLNSLANTGIKVMVMLPNANLPDAASTPSSALDWVRNNVAAYYPATKITAVAVGNEVFDMRPDLNSQLVTLMTNVHAALEQLGLADKVTVTTPIAFTAVTDSFPPSLGRFVDNIAESVMRPMLQFLQQTGSFLSINLYPYIAQLDNPNISLDYALGNYATGVPADGKTYHSLLDAQLDATYSAMEKLGFSDSRRRLASRRSVKVYVTETGRPSRGRIRSGGHARRLADGDGLDSITVANAQTYNNYVINRVLAGSTGTPAHPDADMDVFIFALFNENLKGGSDSLEANFGLFDPVTMQKIYDFSFGGGPVTDTWCVANAAVGDQRLQAALDFACGHGADCSAIQPGATCFQPDTKVAHASYAFNDYYRRNGPVTSTVPPPSSTRHQTSVGAGAWRTPRSGPRACRRHWTSLADTALTAVPSSPAPRASSQTQSSTMPPTHSIATTKTRVGLPGRATSTASAPSSINHKRLETACSLLRMPDRLRFNSRNNGEV